MKYVKENLTLVICGAVALLFLVFAFAPIPSRAVAEGALAATCRNGTTHQDDPAVVEGAAGAAGADPATGYPRTHG